jgi:hypothetical protein
MSVLRRENWLSQERVDVPGMRSVESAVSNDFDGLIQSLITGTSQGYIMRGFNIAMAGAIGGAASGLQVVVDPGAVLHILASQSGTFYLVPSGTPNQILNSATNTIVNGAFVPNAINYVGLDYVRAADSTTDAQSYFWDPSTDTETTKIVPQAIIMSYTLNISTSSWPSNILPIATVTTDAGNNVVSITDARWMLFRLGQGGASPNPFYVYPWTAQPQGRVEDPSTSSSDASDPFAGGDKMLGTFKDWMNALMSAILEIRGTTYWYELGSAGSLAKLREDLANTVTTGVGTITHSLTTAGLVNWSDPIFMKVVGSSLSYEIAANPSSTDITLADDEVAYITLNRDATIVPNLFYVYNSIPNTTTVTSIGAVSWTSSLVANDFLRAASDPDSLYTQIKTVDSLTQVTLYGNYVPAGMTAAGVQSVYAFGSYAPAVSPSTPRDIFITTRESVPVGQNVWWFLLRADNGGIPRVYVRFLGSELEQGESEEIDSDVPIGLLNYIGTSMQGVNNGLGPQYVSALSPGAVPQITQITFGSGSTVSPSQYFNIYSSGNHREYYVWYKINGIGTDPAPSLTEIGIEVDILSSDSANAVATKTRTALLTTDDFTAPAPVGAVLTVTNSSAGVTTNAANVNVGAPFSISTTQSGTGIGNAVIHDGDNLTLAIKELDQAIGILITNENAANGPDYVEVINIVSPISSGTNIMIPVNSRIAGSPQQYYTVGQGKLEVYLNGQYLQLGDDWAEVGSSGSASDLIQILSNLKAGDFLEFRIDAGAGAPVAGPAGPAGPTGPTGPAGANAVGGPVAISTKTSNYALMVGDNVILVDCTSGPITITLPSPASSVGHVYFVKKIDSTVNAVSIIASGGALIDGLGTQTLPVQYDSDMLVNDGTSYWLV